MPDLDGYFHPTELECYQLCPMLYKFQHVDRLEPPYQSWYKIRGSIIHAVLEMGFDSFDAMFIKHTAGRDDIGASEETIQKDRIKMREQCQSYFQYLAINHIHIIEREVSMTYTLCGEKFMCRLDAIAKHEDTPKGMVEIHDYKTGTKWCYPSMNRKIQFGHYYWAAGANSYNVNRVWWGQTQDLLRYKTDGKKAVKGQWRGQFLYPIKIGSDLIGNVDAQTDMAYIIASSNPIIRAINAEIFYPNNYSQQCRLCEYERVCPKFAVGITSDNTFEIATEKDKELEAQLRASMEKE